MAVLLERGGVRTSLLCHTEEQARELAGKRENVRYLQGVKLAHRINVRAFGSEDDQSSRADLILLAVPSQGLGEAIDRLARRGVPERAYVVSLAKGLVPPDGTPPTVALEQVFGAERVGCVGGPAHAREMVESGAGLVCASHSAALANEVAQVFQNAGVVCEVSSDPVGVELAGCAKNAAALASGATEAQGLNAAGMAAADIFSEVTALARSYGAQRKTFIGRAGIGDLVATALAPTSRNRSAGELLADGVPGSEIPERLGQAAEALETVPLLARAIQRAGVEAPVTSALARLIEGSLPLEEWVALVRARQPEPARFARSWLRRFFTRRRQRRNARR